MVVLKGRERKSRHAPLTLRTLCIASYCICPFSSPLIMADNISVRVTSAQLPKYVGQKVRLVGKTIKVRVL